VKSWYSFPEEQGYNKNIKEAKKYSRLCQITPTGASSQVKKHE
jgi:hypothetical protein